MLKRENYYLRWYEQAGAWAIMGQDGLYRLDPRKRDAIRIAAEYCRERWAGGFACELTIFTKKGRIQKGPSGKRSFGRDPRRHRG